MPYAAKKVKGGYKACKKNGKKCFSKKPMKTKKEAVKQIGAIASSEKRKLKGESFDEMINNLLSEYIFEDKKQYSEDDEDSTVSDQEVGKEVQDIKAQKQKQISSVNPAEVKKIMQGAKKIGVPIGSQPQ